MEFIFLFFCHPSIVSQHYGDGSSKFNLVNREYTRVRFGIRIDEGTVLDNVTFNPKILDVTYEPPSQYKLPIIIQSKNLISNNHSTATKLQNGVTFTDNGDGSVTVDGTADDILNPSFLFYNVQNKLLANLKVGDKVILSAKSDKSWGDSNINVVCNYYDKSGVMKTGGGIGNETLTRTITVTEDWFGMAIYVVVLKTKSANNITIYPQLQIADTDDTSYEPHRLPYRTNIYLDEPLRSTPNISDIIDFKNNKVIRNVCSAILDGTEDWQTEKTSSITQDTAYVSIVNPPKKMGYGAGAIISTGTFTPNRYAFADYEGWTSWGNPASTIMYRKDGITVEEIKQLLKEHPTEVIAQLKTPTDEIIDIPELPSFKGTTIYEIDSDVIPSNMKVRYISK